MCVIIVKPAGSTLTTEEITNCFENNPDGLGWMYSEDGKVIADKILPESVEEIEEVLDKLKDRECVIHFRYLTTGELTTSHAHPFRLLKKSKKHPDLFMMHNGTFKVTAREGENDTIAFKNTILKPVLSRDYTLLDDSNFIKMIEGMDNWSRLCFLDGNGNITRTRSHSWVKRRDMYLSNSYSLTVGYRKPVTPVKRPPYKAPVNPSGETKGKWVGHTDGKGWNYVLPDGTITKEIKGGSHVINDLTPIYPKGNSKMNDDSIVTQDLLRTMDEHELLKWIKADVDDVVNILYKQYSQPIVSDALATMGISYSFNPTESDIEYWVDCYPEEVLEFFKGGYDEAVEDYKEFYNETN